MKTETKTKVVDEKPRANYKTSKTQMKSKKDSYYIIVEEWRYPDEERREPIEMSFDSKDGALAYAGSMANAEQYNFTNEVGCYACSMRKEKPANGDCGSVFLRPIGSDGKWYFAARVFEIVKLMDFSA